MTLSETDKHIYSTHTQQQQQQQTHNKQIQTINTLTQTNPPTHGTFKKQLGIVSTGVNNAFTLKNITT